MSAVASESGNHRGVYGRNWRQRLNSPLSEGSETLLRSTWYYLVRESDYSQKSKSDAIHDKVGNVIAAVSPQFKRALDIEGSGKLDDGRVVNFSGVVAKEIRYHVSLNPEGDGVGRCALQSFHTAAVDPRVIPLGSLLKIQETVGMPLPDGTLHDGLWRAEDVGGAIKADRIDLFVGAGKSGGIRLERWGVKHLRPLHVQIVKGPSKDSCVRRR